MLDFISQNYSILIFINNTDQTNSAPAFSCFLLFLLFTSFQMRRAKDRSFLSKLSSSKDVCRSSPLRAPSIIKLQEMEKQENTPQYIKQLPWYAQDSQGGGELIKIPAFEPKGFLEQWYQRGQKGHQAFQYRKGACQNCGAMGHKKKECTERPRKIGARFTNKGIAADDLVKEVGDSWQVKRDRWNGYTPEMYKDVIDDFNQYEEVRKKVKGQEDESRKDENPLLAADLPTKAYKEKFVGLNTGRNREDRAKYLYNLDVNSAEFDPKSRTLEGEDEYLKQLSNLEAVGEKAALEDQDNFAVEQVEKHHMELNSTALPTLTQKIFKSVKQKKAGLSSGRLGDIMKRYGVKQDGSIPEVEENEQEAVENFLRGKRQVKSKYEEDVLNNDHLSVWGSWYNKYLGWGYACCYSTDKLSYCSGVKGRERALAKQYKIRAAEAKQLSQVEVLEQGEEQKSEKGEKDEKDE